MTEHASSRRTLVAALPAAALSYGLAVVVSWHLLAAARGGSARPSAELAWLALQDLPQRWAWGLLLLLAHGLLALPAARLCRRAGWAAWGVYPLAGLAALALALWGPAAAFGPAPLPGADSWPGAALYLAAGLLGGLAWAALARRTGSEGAPPR